MKKLYRALITVAVLLCSLLVGTPAHASGPTVTVGYAYQDVYLSGSRVPVNIVNFQGNCDSSGYLTHNPYNPGQKYGTGISSISVTGAGCNAVAAYTGTQGTSNFRVCWSGRAPGLNFNPYCDDAITYIRVYRIG